MFFDVEINGEAAGRIVMGVYGGIVPKTTANFIGLCKGDAVRSNRNIPALIMLAENRSTVMLAGLLAGQDKPRLCDLKIETGEDRIYRCLKVLERI